MTNRFFFGLDLGQSKDYTAIAILEQMGAAPGTTAPSPRPHVGFHEFAGTRYPAKKRVQDSPAQRAALAKLKAEAEEQRKRGATYHVRHLERFPLGTLYPTIVARVAQMLDTPELKGQTQLVADATGVGRPVVDMLRAAGLFPIAVTITGGDNVTTEGGFTRVPKRDLVSVLQVALQTERLKFIKGAPEVDTFVSEAMAFQVKITTSANDTYGAWREGTHDDLVLAGALALWQGERFAGQPVLQPKQSWSHRY